jgi:hypothetical protein
MTETKMTAGELTSHLQQTMRTDIAAHLREVHGMTEVPKTKQAQHKAHQKAHAEDAPATDAQTSKDASVLAGVTRKPEETKVTPKPATRTRTPKAAAKPATKATGRKPAASKPATKATAKPDPKSNGKAPADTNGSVSPRETNQALAVRLVNLVAAEFGNLSVEDQTKIANWLKVLPTGGAAWQRYWPENFARPTTADWRKPE